MIEALFSDCLKALGQLRDGRTLLLLAISVLCAFVVLTGSVATISWLLSGLGLSGYGWLDSVIQWAGTAIASVLGWILYPLVITAILGLFSDQICDAVERTHYPDLGEARGLPLAASLMEALGFLGKALLLNILVLPLYLLPGPNIIIYLGLNGWLLGREYFGNVGFRRQNRQEHRELRRNLRFEVWLAGSLIAGLLIIPFINLLVPVLGLALMVHQYNRYTRPPQIN